MNRYISLFFADVKKFKSEKKPIIKIKKIENLNKIDISIKSKKNPRSIGPPTSGIFFEEVNF